MWQLPHRRCINVLPSSHLKEVRIQDVYKRQPTDNPTNTLIIKLISEAVEPTAASAVLPANLPTTMMSAALKSS